MNGDGGDLLFGEQPGESGSCDSWDHMIWEQLVKTGRCESGDLNIGEKLGNKGSCDSWDIMIWEQIGKRGSCDSCYYMIKGIVHLINKPHIKALFGCAKSNGDIVLAQKSLFFM